MRWPLKKTPREAPSQQAAQPDFLLLCLSMIHFAGLGSLTSCATEKKRKQSNAIKIAGHTSIIPQQHAAKHGLRLERLENASGDPPRLLGRDGEASASLREAVAGTRWAALEAAEAGERVARPWSEEHGPLVQIFRLTRAAEDLTPDW